MKKMYYLQPPSIYLPILQGQIWLRHCNIPPYLQPPSLHLPILQELVKKLILDFFKQTLPFLSSSHFTSSRSFAFSLITNLPCLSLIPLNSPFHTYSITCFLSMCFGITIILHLAALNFRPTSKPEPKKFCNLLSVFFIHPSLPFSREAAGAPRKEDERKARREEEKEPRLKLSKVSHVPGKKSAVEVMRVT